MSGKKFVKVEIDENYDIFVVLENKRSEQKAYEVGISLKNIIANVIVNTFENLGIISPLNEFSNFLDIFLKSYEDEDKITDIILRV